jgi:hypothetical protein
MCTSPLYNFCMKRGIICGGIYVALINLSPSSIWCNDIDIINLSVTALLTTKRRFVSTKHYLVKVHNKNVL